MTRVDGVFLSAAVAGALAYFGIRAGQVLDSYYPGKPLWSSMEFGNWFWLWFGSWLVVWSLVPRGSPEQGGGATWKSAVSGAISSVLAAAAGGTAYLGVKVAFDPAATYHYLVYLRGSPAGMLGHALGEWTAVTVGWLLVVVVPLYVVRLLCLWVWSAAKSQITNRGLRR